MASLEGGLSSLFTPRIQRGVLETGFLKPRVQTLVARVLSLEVCAFLSPSGGSMCPCLSSLRTGRVAQSSREHS